MKKVQLEGKFINEGKECVLLNAIRENRAIIVEYMNSDGEVLECGAHELDDATAIEVCRQLEIATGVDYDYRNLNL